jgi:hypothetical protein
MRVAVVVAPRAPACATRRSPARVSTTSRRNLRAVARRAHSADDETDYRSASSSSANDRNDATTSSRSRRVSWDDRFTELSVYAAMHGTIEFPRELNVQRRWLARQRYEARRGALREDRRARLESLGVTFELRKRVCETTKETIPFETRLRELAVHYAAHGRGGVKARENPTLAKWVSHQVAAFRDGALGEDKKRALEELGVDFDGAEERRASRWEERYEELKAYREESSDDGADVGGLAVPENRNDGLYHWLLDQRRAKARGTLSKERVDALEALGVEWNVQKRSTVSWETSFDNVKAQYEGAGRLPRNKDDSAAFQWIRSQRRRFEKGTLEPERAERLDAAFGDAWRVKKLGTFEKNLDNLKEYKKKHGTAWVLPKHDKKLAAWTRKMRVKKSCGELSRSKIAALDAIGMPWTNNGVFDCDQDDPSCDLFGSTFT